MIFKSFKIFENNVNFYLKFSICVLNTGKERQVYYEMTKGVQWIPIDRVG